jgi:hypothetical protein
MKSNRAQLIPGLVLILLGIALLLAQYFEFGPGLFLTLLGLAFLILYATMHSYGLLVPGCILAGIGLGLLFDRPPLISQVAVPIGLGFGFIAIFVAQLVVMRTLHWWPLIPGSILIVVGVAEGVPQAQTLIEKGWPLILVAIGLIILSASFIQMRTKDGS